MNELLWMLVGATIMLAGFLTGVYVGKRQTLMVFGEPSNEVTGSREVIQTIDLPPRSGSKTKKEDFPKVVEFKKPWEKAKDTTDDARS